MDSVALSHVGRSCHPNPLHEESAAQHSIPAGRFARKIAGILEVARQRARGN